MSVDIHVILKKSNLPSPGRWQQAIAESGFPLQIDTDFDPEEFFGFLPCRYRDEEAGFEYSFEPLPEDFLDEEDMKRVGDRDCLVTFSTYSSMDDFIASTIASCVLCQISDGLLLDEDADDLFLSADAAIAYGRKMESELLEEKSTDPIHAESSEHRQMPAIEVSITVDGQQSPLDVSYLGSPCYQELRARQLEIISSVGDEEPTQAQRKELQAINEELEKMRNAS
jgi:hypothetical protein